MNKPQQFRILGQAALQPVAKIIETLQLSLL